jgi:hypothetical protein
VRHDETRDIEIWDDGIRWKTSHHQLQHQHRQRGSEKREIEASRAPTRNPPTSPQNTASGVWGVVITRSSDKLEATEATVDGDHSGLRKGSPSQGYGGVLEAAGGGFDKDRRYRLAISIPIPKSIPPANRRSLS